MPRPDRRFYASNSAFGRFGIRWFDPADHADGALHGHIELNWLTAGKHGLRASTASRCTVPSERLVMFWAGIPHQTMRSRSRSRRRQPPVQRLPAARHVPAHAQSRHADRNDDGRRRDRAARRTPSATRPCAAGTRTIAAAMPSAPTSSRRRSPSCCAAPRSTGWEELLPPWIEAVTPDDARRDAAALRRRDDPACPGTSVRAAARPRMSPRSWGCTPTTRSTSSPR